MNTEQPLSESKDRKQILRTRAEALAQEEKKQAAAASYIEVAEFLLASERYGVESRFVREVYALKDLTPVPCTPPFVAGIINVRGQILTVIDIKKFFELPDKGISDLNKVLILRLGNLELGILADVMLGVRSLPLDDLQASLPTLIGIRAEYLRGVTPDRLVVLDAERILAAQKILVNEEVGG
jgi:purine-binding chemotaxis protein CheW